ESSLKTRQNCETKLPHVQLAQGGPQNSTGMTRKLRVLGRRHKKSLKIVGGISSFVSLFRIEVKTSLLLLPLVLMLAISIPNSLTYQILAQGPTQNNEQSFATSFQGIVAETNSLAEDYDDQVGKWKIGELSNETMASITDTYSPKYQELINKTNALRTPAGYENVTSLYAKSLESELESHTQFKNYLLTGNTTENEASIQSLSDGYRYESESFKAFMPLMQIINK
ncbi:MAG: hypothetical protein WBW34_13560, partial [Nitrososphaeraceae archaeon]